MREPVRTRADQYTQDGVIKLQEQQKEKALLKRCSSGDQEAIMYIVNHYRPRAVRLAARIMHNSRDAEDVAQEAFLRVFRQIDQFRGESSFYGWLYRIVLNICLDHLRRKRSVSEMLPLHIDQVASHGAHPDHIEHKLSVEKVLSSLSPPMRSALMLREIDGMDYSEIAQELDIPLGTVRSRLNAARSQFRKGWIALEQEADMV